MGNTTKIALPRRTIIDIRLDRPIYATTDGNGYWTYTKQRIRVDHIEVRQKWYGERAGTDPAYLACEVRAYFTPQDWRVMRDGLIYTDPRWIREFRKEFYKLPGFRHIVKRTGPNMLDYTEQGMQGTNYVSMDFVISGDEIIDSFCAYHNIRLIGD